MSYLPAFHYYSGPFLYAAAKRLAKPQEMPNMRGNKRKRSGTMGGRKRSKAYTATKQGGRRGAPGQMTMQPALGAGRMTYSPGLSVGKYRPMSTTQRLQAAGNPAQTFNSKWTFQMDCGSGRVTAATIPVLVKALVDPIFKQLFYNATTDTTTKSTLLAENTLDAQYAIAIENYKSTLKFYNSSSQCAKCRLVWYKPRDDLPENYTLDSTPTYLPYGPLNMLMWASNLNQPPVITGSGLVNPAVGDGVLFDGATTFSNYNANYAHAGWALSGVNTTIGQTPNTVAYLDQSLVPANPQIRALHGKYWKEARSEDFTLEPGHQHNTSLKIKNRIIKNGGPDQHTHFFKGSSYVAVLYVLGQIVFNDSTIVGAPDSQKYAISTGSSQISVLREDTCKMRPVVTKKRFRLNLTNNYQIINASEQGNINPETDVVNTIFASDEF